MYIYIYICTRNMNEKSVKSMGHTIDTILAT